MEYGFDHNRNKIPIYHIFYLLKEDYRVSGCLHGSLKLLFVRLPVELALVSLVYSRTCRVLNDDGHPRAMSHDYPHKSPESSGGKTQLLPGHA